MLCFLPCCFPDEDTKEEGGLNIALDEESGEKRTFDACSLDHNLR
jgi:hypothetical protein